MGDRQNYEPSSWGPPAWNFLDTIFLSYPVKASYYDRMWMVELLTVLGDALPCERCRSNYKSYLNQYPVVDHVQGRDMVIAYMRAYKTWAKQK